MSDVTKLRTVLKHSMITNIDEIVLSSCFARILKVHCIILM